MLSENFCGCLLRSSEGVWMQNVCAKLARVLLRRYKPFLACCHAVAKVFGVVAIALLGAYLQAQVKRVPTSLYGFVHTMQGKLILFILNLIFLLNDNWKCMPYMAISDIFFVQTAVVFLSCLTNNSTLYRQTIYEGYSENQVSYDFCPIHNTKKSLSNRQCIFFTTFQIAWQICCFFPVQTSCFS